MATAIQPHMTFFARGGFPKDTAQRLRKDARALGEWVKSSEAKRAALSRATRDIQQCVSDARATISYLAALVPVRLASERGGEAMLQLWRQYERMPAKKGRPRARKALPSAPAQA
jgi:hypothetical protein